MVVSRSKGPGNAALMPAKKPADIDFTLLYSSRAVVVVHMDLRVSQPDGKDKLVRCHSEDRDAQSTRRGELT